MKWHPVTEPPPLGSRVLGVRLQRFTNAPWRWTEPNVYSYRVDDRYPESGPRWVSDYYEPELWCEIEYPDVPETPEHAKAIATGEMLAELAKQEEEIKRTRRALLFHG